MDDHAPPPPPTHRTLLDRLAVCARISEERGRETALTIRAAHDALTRTYRSLARHKPDANPPPPEEGQTPRA